jgi:hypothetical protein
MKKGKKERKRRRTGYVALVSGLILECVDGVVVALFETRCTMS